MAVTGTEVSIGDALYRNIAEYTVSEEVPAVDPSVEGGAVGQTSITVLDQPVAKSFIGKQMRLKDGQQGVISGKVLGASGDGIAATIVAESRLGLLNVQRRIQPFRGTLGAYLRSCLASCGITEDITIDGALESIPITVLGWKGQVYPQLKRLGVVHGFEPALVDDKIVFRPIRTRVAAMHRNDTEGWSQDASTLAQTVEGYYYNTRWATDLAYPSVNGWNDDVEVFTVKAGEVLEVELPLAVDPTDDNPTGYGASLVSVQQPVCKEKVGKTDRGSVYSVSGNDGLPIKPAQWLNGGGKIEVTIGEDTRTLKLKIIGSVEERYAPYSIAMSSGPSDSYSSLRIRGTGVFYEKRLYTLPATLDPDEAPEELGATVDIEFYQTRSQLHSALLWTAAHYSGVNQSINVTTKGTHLITDLEDRAFGNIAGARVLKDDCWYRIRTVSTTPGQVSYQAEWDNTMADAFPGTETFAEWEARWEGKTFADFEAAPVRGIRTNGIPLTHFYPASDLYPAPDLYPA